MRSIILVFLIWRVYNIKDKVGQLVLDGDNDELFGEEKVIESVN